MKRRRKIVIITYYHFPCNEPVLENVFAKEIGREHDIIWLFMGDVSSGRINIWHNSRIILCKKVKGASFLSKCINKMLGLQKLFLLLFLVVFRDTKIVMIRDMPLVAILIAPFRIFFKFQIYFQYTAPLGDIALGYARYNKTKKRWWYLLVGHPFNILIKQALKISDLIFPISDLQKKPL